MKNRFNQILFTAVFAITSIIMITQNTYASPATAQSNPNTPSEWAKAEIEKAKEIELLPEGIQGEYKSSITREEFSELAVKLYEALEGKEAELQEKNPFTDTENEKIIIASQLGIVQGKGNGQFDPKNSVTREEIAVMLYRTLQAAKPDYNYPISSEYIFLDHNMISTWAKGSVTYLYKAGIINGVGDNRFNPKGHASREEAIVLAKKIYEKILVSEKASSDNLIVSRGSSLRQESIMKLKLEKLISEEMGKPYKWGGTGPDGYDCSGLVYSIFGKLGISLPRTSRDQGKVGTYVPKEDLAYGDLVLFARDGKNINHVGIYVGNGEFAHSPESGQVVKKTTLMSGYYANSYYTARRVLP